MTDFEYRKTLIVGAIIGSSIVLLALYWAKPSSETPVTPKSSFAVVDTYKDCKVIQWTNGMQAEYKYFLDCTDSMRNK